MRAALAVATGVLLGLCFPRFSMGYFGLVALLPLLFAIRMPGAPPERAASPRRAFGLGYLAGAVFFLILLYWIPMLPPQNVTVPFLMYPALALMVIYLSLFPALAAASAAWLTRRGVAVGLALPLTWTLLEAARGTGLFGFPWGSLGYAFAPYPHLIQFASLTGIWGVTLWAALTAGLVHIYLSVAWVRPKMLALAALVAIVAAPYFYGRDVLARREVRPAVRVGMVQPNVGANKWQPSVRDSVVEALLTHTADLAREEGAGRLDLMVWPETAIPARLPREPYYRLETEAMVDSAGVPLLAGFPDGVRLEDGSVRFTNSAALILPGRGIVARYDKRHLVPFSEFFPLPFLNRYDFGQSDFSGGDEPGIFTELDVPFGVLICFESIFPGEARELSNLGARYLVNITNDQWFGDSAAPYQHFEMNVLRAIENHMGMARAANTGISAAIDPYGFVTDRTPVFVQMNQVALVELGHGPTFYARHGNWILILAGAVLAGLVVYALLRRRRA